MYFQYYGLKEQPFGVTPDPQYLYLSAGHREALASLIYGIEAGMGFAALIAPPGMGKTTLLFYILEKFRASARTAFIFQTQCSRVEFLRYLASELEVPAETSDSFELNERIRDVLIQEARLGRRVIVVVDEAQNLNPEALEAIRLLSDYETPTAKLLHIILAGQTELADKISQPGMSQLLQRLAMVNRLNPLTAEEVANYIDYRLATAGYAGHPLFTTEAIASISRMSGGIPRNINRICFNALSLGFALNQRQIGIDLIHEVGEDLGVASTLVENGPIGLPPSFDQVSSKSGPSVSSSGDPDPLTATPIAAPVADPAPRPAEQSLRPEPLPPPSPRKLESSAQYAPAVAPIVVPLVRENKATATPAPSSIVPLQGKSRGVFFWMTIFLAVAIVLGAFALWQRGLILGTHAASPLPASPSSEDNTSSLPPAESPAELAPASEKEIGTVGSLPHSSSASPASRSVSPSTRNPRSAVTQESPPHVLVPTGVTRKSAPAAEDLHPPQIAVANAPVSVDLGPKGSPALAPYASSDVQPAQLIRRIEPAYPSAAHQSHVSGRVVIGAVIGRDGRTRNVHAVSGNPLLAQAAVDAVRKWLYRPYLLNGEPMDVGTQIIFNFELPKQ